MEVDHFDPREKKKVNQRYGNLFLASRHSNLSKTDTWPTRAEQADGLRFLNPCKEQYYGAVIFENPRTHVLVGLTPAARWQIRIIDLNAAHLVEERRRRAELRHLLNRGPITAGFYADEFILKIVELLKLMIPEIPAPPVAGGTLSPR